MKFVAGRELKIEKLGANRSAGVYTFFEKNQSAICTALIGLVYGDGFYCAEKRDRMALFKTFQFDHMYDARVPGKRKNLECNRWL